MHTTKLVLVFALLGFAACGKGKAGDDKAAAGDKSVVVSTAMKGFTDAFKGKSKDVTAALKSFGVDGLDSKDMDMYDLATPMVLALDKRGEQECYTFEAKAGMTTRTYETCWVNGKITTVADKGMR